MSNLTKSPGLDLDYAKSSIATRDYLAMCLIHDNTLRPLFCKPDEAFKVIKIKQDFRIGDPEVKFYPYWGESQPVTADGKEFYTGIWENKGEFLVVVANLSLSDQTVTVTLDNAKIPADLKVLDAESKKPVSVSGGKFKVSIPRRNFKLYWIKK